MSRARKPVTDAVADQVLDEPDSTLLDVLDNLLNKGVMANGDVTLGVAGIDLIYLRLSTLLCASDRVDPPSRTPAVSRQSRRRRKPPLLKRRD
jgi:gas vesicle structural protein